MFNIFHPGYLPVASRDDHRHAHEHVGAVESACQRTSPLPANFPFLCSRVTGHDGPHQAATSLHGPLVHLRTMRPPASDTIAIAAEWDDNRDTDGVA